ncbi:MAG: DHA2 family efflux MFS transporter permease subunit [Gammaproteobacteria bacterium]
MSGHPPLTGAARVAASIAVSMSVFMQVLDLTITNVATPTIAGDLGVSFTQGTWVITSYAVSTAVCTPLSGWLARRYGELRLYLVAASLFTFASWCCGLASDLPTLVGFRVLQGLAAGPMMPLAQTLLFSIYPPEKRGIALAVSMTTAVVAPVIGPWAGGVITDTWSWPWVFYINVPLGIVSVLLTAVLFRGRETPVQRTPVDTLGFVLVVVGVGSLQLALDRGNELDWFGSPLIVTLMVVAAVTLAYMVVWELTDPHPVVDLRLFRSWHFSASVFLQAASFALYFGNVVIFPLWLQVGMGFSASWAGLTVAPMGLPMLLLTPLTGRIIHRVDPRLVAMASFTLFGLGAYVSAGLSPQADLWHLVATRLLYGAGVGLMSVPLNTMILRDIPMTQMASAVGLANFARMLLASFMTAAVVALWDHRQALHRSQLVEHVSGWDESSRMAFDVLAGVGLHGQRAAAAMERVISPQAMAMATNDFFVLSAWCFAALVLILWTTRRGRSPFQRAVPAPVAAE